ncbi:MAG: hypothetical protein GXY15_00870 [Candidatus Hydrogenedentes bacterium]|nr:hypothetical protein [Candidatus Hydrogenedentota bacterium]
MTRQWKALVLALAGAALLAGCRPCEPVAPHPVAVGSGLYLDRTLFDRNRRDTIVSLAAEAGLHWTREEFLWEGIEPAPGQHSESLLERHDARVTKLAAAGIQILGLLDYGAEWSTGGGAPSTDEQRADFARHAAFMAERYRGVITHWEVWNEPNLEKFWHGTPDPEGYGLLLRAAADALRAVDPEIQVVGGAIAGCGRDDRAFLMRALAAAGPGACDIVSIHPYSGESPWDRSDGPGNVCALRRQLAEAGWSVPLWSTECGHSTCDDGVAVEEQPGLLVRMYLSQFAAGIENVISYDFVDDGMDPLEKEHHWGMLYHDLEPKPSLRVVGVLAGLLEGAWVHGHFQDGGVEAVRFEKDGGLTLWAVWAGAEYPENDPLASQRGRVFTLDGLLSSDTVTALDLHGRLLVVDREGGTARLEAGGSPRYLFIQSAGG